MTVEADRAEQSRQAALDQLAVLDTPPEETFDRLVSMARDVFQIETALVSLVDRDRQWFKARCGIVDSDETPREWAFCDYTIRTQEIFEVLDASSDERFADNPLVHQNPGIRYYAGAPLTNSAGAALGSFCILDNKPRSALTDRERRVLHYFAALAVREMELRQALRSALSQVIHSI